MMPLSAQPAPLLVGAVRDGQGRPIAGASIRAVAADGSSVGAASSDAAGTFAVTLERRPASVEVRCSYCATERVPVSPDKADEPLVVIVRRYHALSDEGPSQRDLQVLPYRRPSDALGLFPYLVPARSYPLYGDSLSDRGLDLGYALVLDQGAPTYDMAGQTTAFATVPSGAVQRVDIEPASMAYRYGSYAGGGTFALDALGDAPYAVAFDSGQDGSFAGYSRFGNFAPSVAESLDHDDGTARRRRV